MLNLRSFGFLIALLFLLSGCGSNLVRLTGQLNENGKPVRLENGQSVQIDFITADGGYPPLNLGVYVKADGSFAVDMNDGTGQGLPPGKYKIRFNGEGTSIKNNIAPRLFKEPYVIEVSKGVFKKLTVEIAEGVISEK